MSRYFLMTDSNPKTTKGETLGYLTLILHLLPYDFSGYQACPKANGCQLTCLTWSGRGRMERAIAARLRRTKLFFEDREAFMQMIVSDINVGLVAAKLQGLTLAVRLNGTSDLPWEKIRTAKHRNLMEEFPDTIFYDYTKVPGRSLPANYRLTFSQDEHNEEACRGYLMAGVKVATLFDGGKPDTHLGYKVIDGDLHDLRFLDPKPRIVGLRRKVTRMPEAFREEVTQ